VVSVFLGHYKQYQSSLVTPYGGGVLHDMGPDEDVKDLSGGDCDTPEN
jgi:hypothetical protein